MKASVSMQLHYHVFESTSAMANRARVFKFAIDEEVRHSIDVDKGLARWAAMMQRAYLPAFQRRTPIRARIEMILPDLEGPTGLRQEIAFNHLSRWRDLFDEESALSAETRSAQVRLLQAAASNERVSETIRRGLSEAPISRLFQAIVAQAHVNGADRIRVDFAPLEPSFMVSYREDLEWKEAMKVPINLAKPFEGMCRLTEDAGFKVLRPYWCDRHELPDSVEFSWTDSRLEVTLLP
jgi:hypothetical protein